MQLKAFKNVKCYLKSRIPLKTYSYQFLPINSLLSYCFYKICLYKIMILVKVMNLYWRMTEAKAWMKGKAKSKGFGRRDWSNWTVRSSWKRVYWASVVEIFRCFRTLVKYQRAPLALEKVDYSKRRSSRWLRCWSRYHVPLQKLN